MGLHDTESDEIPTTTAPAPEPAPESLPATTPEPASAEIPVQADIGEVGYNAYCSDRGWKAFNGEPLPQWPEVKDDIKNAWRKAGLAVVAAFERATVAIFSESDKPASPEVQLETK